MYLKNQFDFVGL